MALITPFSATTTCVEQRKIFVRRLSTISSPYSPLFVWKNCGGGMFLV
jgi:hypothetical protein